MNTVNYFMKSGNGVSSMTNLQIKGIDDDLYREIREMAKDEHRSVSQQILYMTKLFMTKRKAVEQSKTSAEILLELAGSWDDERPAEEIVAEIREARKSSARLSEGLDVSA
jgi:predicted CopG family antitoxin